MIIYKMSKYIFLLSAVIVGICSLPATFDIRYQPNVAIYANFESSSDLICQSYSWAKQLAQVFSNKVSVELKQKIVLSAQQIAECIPGQNDKCKQATLKNIQDGLKYIQSEGVNEESCYNNKFFQLPSKYCGRKCTDGKPFIRKFKSIVNKQISPQRFLQSLGNGEVFGVAVVKFYEAMTFYSAEKPQNMKIEGQLFTYGVAEIVGWRKQGEQLNLRMGAPGWGYKGYAWVPTTSPIIINLYSIGLLSSQVLTQ